MSSRRSLGEITSTLIGFRLVSASASGGNKASVALMRCSRSTSTASASRKMFESAWPAICARFGYSLADALARRLVHAAGADDQDALGAEMHRRRDRRRLAHRAVAAIFGAAGDVERDRREHERDRRRRQQVRDADRGADGEALRARPRQDVVESIVEGHVQPRAVARRGDRERVQVALGHHPLQPAVSTSSWSRPTERRVVEQRARPGAAPARDRPADRHHREPARAGADHAERIGR